MESSRSELTKSLNTDDRFLNELKDAVNEEKEEGMNRTVAKAPLMKKILDVLHDLPTQLHAAKAKKDDVKTKPIVAGLIAFISMVSVFGVMTIISACYCGNFVLAPVPYNRFDNKDIVDLIVNENIKKQASPSAVPPSVNIEVPDGHAAASGVVEIEMGTMTPPQNTIKPSSKK